MEDDVTNHVKRQSAYQINTAIHSLITKERMQKLDLLIHLLSNLPQALVVCGPEGIGKTTLLDVLQQRKTDSWWYCLIQGNAELSFEAIHGQLAQCISQDKQIVLLVDNAGELVPGLIAAIIQYAAANPDLRVVFALTHDELQVKRGSDRVVDDCHIVEIPPLSERQCGDFLQHLSTKPYANLLFKAINENVIAHIYRDTHGVPGRIVAKISGSSVAKPAGKLKWLLAVAASIAIVFGVQWLAPLAHRFVAPGIVLPSELTSMEGVNAPRLPGAVADMPSSANAPGIAVPPAFVQSSKNLDEGNIATSSVEQKMAASTPLTAGIRQQEQSVLAPSIAEVSANEAKDAIEPSVEVNTHSDDQQLVTPVAKPEAASTIVIKQPENKPSDGAQQKTTEPLGVKQEKPKQPGLSKTVNNVEQPTPEKLKIKGKPEPRSGFVVAQMPKNKQSAVAQQKIAEPFNPEKSVDKAQTGPLSVVGVDPKLDNKQPDFTQKKITEPLVTSLEKPKQEELSKTVNSVEPYTPNKLEAPQILQKPVEVVEAPNEPVLDMVVPQQVEPGRIGSLPIATLPPSLAVEGSLAPSANNFTLQLMVLSKNSSVDDLLKKYPALEPDIRVIKTITKGKGKLILEYGSYPDAASANKAMQSLPFEFHNALVRKQGSR